MRTHRRRRGLASLEMALALPFLLFMAAIIFKVAEACLSKTGTALHARHDGWKKRDEALERVSKPELDEATMAQEFEYVATKLGWTVAEFEEIFKGRNKSFRDYKNNMFLITLGANIFNLLGLDNRIFR